MSEPLVRTERTDGVALIAFHRPDRHNALDDALVAAWRSAVEDATSDPSVRAILLLGDGPSFSSGRDTTELGRRANDESDHEFVRRTQQLNRMLLASRAPVIASVHGHVVGGAVEIAAAADVRIAAADVRFVLPEIRFGLLPDTGASALLTRLVGPSRTKLMILGAETVDAATALDWGLVDRVVPVEDVHTAALDVARRLASHPPLAVAMGKQLVDQVHRGTVDRAFEAELVAQTALFCSDDHREARAALRDGRTPVYRGR